MEGIEVGATRYEGICEPNEAPRTACTSALSGAPNASMMAESVW